MAESAIDNFLSASQNTINDVVLRDRLRSFSKSFESGISNSLQNFKDPVLARSRAKAIRTRSIENLDKYLIEFESNFIKRGGKVIWAQDNEELLKEVSIILQKSGSDSVLKSKVNTFSDALGSSSKDGAFKFQETDMGDVVQNRFSGRSFHTVLPALNLSLEAIKSKLAVNPTSSIEDIVFDIRKTILPHFSESKVFISGANFLVADPGIISIVENEGNVLRGITNSKIHIVVAGIDKIVPSTKDLDVLLSLLSTYGTNQSLTVFNHLISSPEADGSELYVILVDQLRSHLLGQEDQRDVLNCIGCGACSNVCPVFQTVGGFAYDVYRPGPIGSIMSEYLYDDDKRHLSYASSVCGKCSEVCPVNIEIHKKFLLNRKDIVHRGKGGKGQDLSMYFFKGAVLKRSNMEKGGSTVKNFMLKQFFKGSWGRSRVLPEIAPKSFNQIWKERFSVE